MTYHTAKVALATLIVLGLGEGYQHAAQPTAFELVKKGNPYIGSDSHDQVVRITSERSGPDLVPEVWEIVYYDEDATYKAVTVRFKNGQKTKVKRPWRIAASITGEDRPLPPDKLKVDSDQVMETVRRQPDLKDLKLAAVRLWLEWIQEQPVWRVEVWAEHILEPEEVRSLGEIYISPETGTVMLSELKRGKVER